MIRPLLRVAAVLLTAPFLAFASALTPQHVHDADADHAFAHSHFGPHELAHHDAGVTEIDHGDEHVVWLDSPILHQGEFQLAARAATTPCGISVVAAPPRWAVVENHDAASAHGPPKPGTLFRGPPSLLA